MNPLDQFLINRVFQPIVDWSQRKPIWWVRQAGVAASLMYALHGVLSGWSSWVTIFGLLTTPISTYLITSSEAHVGALGAAATLRRFCLVGVSVQAALLPAIYLLFGVGFPSIYFFSVSAASLAFFYFGACKPPKPRAPRGHGRLQTQGGSA